MCPKTPQGSFSTLLFLAAMLSPIPLLQAQETRSATSARRPIDHAAYISVGGIEQWVTIKGNDRTNPLVLFVHGGPGNPMSLYANVLYRDWLDVVTVVQWDQRYAGKTHERNGSAEELTMTRFLEAEFTIDLLVEDGLELSELLLRRLDQPKLILTGTSWGSVLAVHMLKRQPELFHAYIGVSQLVHGERNMEASYARVHAQAHSQDDGPALAVLDAIGPPPWRNPRSFGQMRRLIREYESAVTSPSLPLHPAPLYDSEAYRAAYSAGEELSFLKFVGFKGDGLVSKIDLTALGPDFAVPVIFIQGTEDLLTTPEITKRYFDRLAAPYKRYIEVTGAGHDPNTAMLHAQREAIVEHVLPLIRRSSHEGATP